jgi:GTPase
LFVDEVWIEVQGGRGGDGAVSFRREKYEPMGGPDGGDGGSGGSVCLWADPSRHSFLDLRYRRHLKAAKGMPGHGQRKNGRNGDDLIVPVPVGTLIKDEQGKVLADLTRPNQKVCVAAGGAGGRGNTHFTSSRRQAPRLAEKGQPGEERRIYLELKLMAQVGLVGFPNAGKSTFLSRISAARPRVANYPFTTITPNLGVVETEDGAGFVVADLPGLIEGAHRGAGLGHRFLRHVERNLLLLLVIDLSPDARPEPAEAYRQLLNELSLFSEQLASYPRVVAGNKTDLPGADERLTQLRRAVEDEVSVFGISAATGSGVAQLTRYLSEQVKRISKTAERMPEEPVIEVKKARKAEGPLFSIEKEGDVFRVRGRRIEMIIAQTDLENEESLQRFQIYCRRSGLEKQLIEMGIVEGDTVRIGSEEFNYYE